jgi:phosphoenolpyruvate carboxylase
MADQDETKRPQALRAELETALERRRAAAAEDAFANPVLGFASTLSARLAKGEVAVADLDAVVQDLTVEAYLARAQRLGDYLGRPDPEKDRAALEALFETVAATGDFDAYAAALARPPFGVVFTAHPTFALDHPLSVALVELATGRDRAGAPLDAAGRAERERLARSRPHAPPGALTLDLEHAWSVEALENAHDGLEQARAAALAVARRRWPDRWRELTPALAVLATWVAFDQDGRTDVTWAVSFEKRLDLKRRALQRHRRALNGLSGRGAADARALIDQALGVTADQLALAAAARADPAEAPAFARAMTAGRSAALVDPAPLMAALDAALAEASDDDGAVRVLSVRGAIAAQGMSLAQVQVRLNARQLLRAIRGEIGLPGAPEDPASRRAWFAAAEERLAAVEPQSINFGSLVAEPTTARRLMMTLAQMLKLVDAASPIRFLIAEAESGFTLLAALYYARLFGVEDKVEISPLFETEQGLGRGEAVFEEALRSPHYREHLERQGRLAVEFGFSDSGRFIGQMAGTFRIERLRLRIAELLEREGLSGLEVVLFGTHGESIGRGGHPCSLADRFRYAAPPRSRAEFARRGLKVREETSFQGGEGYLPFLTGPAALATVRQALAFAYGPAPEAEGDPIYDEPEFSSDFFATIQAAFSDLVEDPDYVALLGLFETRLLHRTGSRPEQRQREGETGPRTLRRVNELRAIPNNGVLQQLGYLANSVFGVGLAAAKDRADFAAMLEGSPRFHRALEMVLVAFDLSDLDVLTAYAAVVDPALWRERWRLEPERAKVFETLARLTARLNLNEPLARAVEAIGAEQRRLETVGAAPDTPRRRRLLLLHAIRAGLIQHIAELAAALPPFPLNQGVARETVQEQLIRLDAPSALATLAEVFPLHAADPLEGADWGEPASYRAGGSQAHPVEHETLFAPLAALHGLCLAITSAVTHEIGACG